MKFSGTILALVLLATLAQAQTWDFSSYPQTGQNVLAPINPAFKTRYDISGVSDSPRKAPNASQSPTGCTEFSKTSCDWGCYECTDPTDVVDCGKPGVWGASFDDGPSEQTPKLLDFLASRNVKVTFCVVGWMVKQNPQIVKRAFDEGHEICIHSWSHWSLPTQSAEQILAELEWTRQIVEQITGTSPRYYRPPYGEVDNRVRAVAKAIGLKGAYLWNKDTNDWKLKGSASLVPQFTTWVNEVNARGVVSLQHDIMPTPVQAAIAALPVVLDSGKYKVMTIAQCIGDAGDALTPITPGGSDGGAGTGSRSGTGIGTDTGTETTGKGKNRTSDAPARNTASLVGYMALLALSLGFLIM